HGSVQDLPGDHGDAFADADGISGRTIAAAVEVWARAGHRRADRSLPADAGVLGRSQDLHHDDAGRMNRRLPSLRRAPALEFLARLRRRRVDAEDRAARFHLLLHEILVCGLLERFLGDRVGNVLRDHRNAFAVADQNIAGIDRDLATGDRYIE